MSVLNKPEEVEDDDEEVDVFSKCKFILILLKITL